MPTFSSFEEFGSAFEQMIKAIERDKKLWALEMGKKAQSIADAQARADLGGDAKFSGWKPTLDTKLKPFATGVAMTPSKTGAGPWTVAEFGRHHGNGAGFSGPGIGKKGLTKKLKSGGVGKVKAVKGKRWNGYTDPKSTASKAIARMESELPPIAAKGLRATELRHFDVD